MLGIFNVRTDVNECDCTRGLNEYRKRVCTESLLWEKSPLPQRGIEPASAACRYDALPTELHPRPHWVVLTEGMATKAARTTLTTLTSNCGCVLFIYCGAVEMIF